jgi:hypothetical protein
LVFVEELSEVASVNSRKTICYDLFEEAVYVSGESGLGRGDVLLFFTDGLFEALNEADVEFGEARLAAAVAKRRDRKIARRSGDRSRTLHREAASLTTMCASWQWSWRKQFGRSGCDPFL